MTFAMEALPGSRRVHRLPTARPSDRLVERTPHQRPRAVRMPARASRATYRRRRLAVALALGVAAVVALRLADLVVGGGVLAAASERLVTVVAFVGWCWAALALLCWDRPRPSAVVAESGESCRSLDPAASLPLAS